MPRLVNRAPWAAGVTEGLPGIQSRQVVLELKVVGGIGLHSYAYTPPLGQRLVLHGVRLDLWGHMPAKVFGGFISIAIGGTEPGSGSEIALEWDQVMQYVGGKPMMYWWGYEACSFYWPMRRHYARLARRFAVNVANGFAEQWWLWCSFEISEG